MHWPRRTPEQQCEPQDEVNPSRTPNLGRDANKKQSRRPLAAKTGALRTCSGVQYIGPTGDVEPALLELALFGQHHESVAFRGGVKKVGDADMYLVQPERTAAEQGARLGDLQTLENTVSPHGAALVDLYFEFVHPNFPILQQNSFREDYRSITAAVPPPLLTAVYLLAWDWRARDTRTRDAPDLDTERLEAAAVTSLQLAMNRPDISTVQAGLLLLQRPSTGGWPLTSQLVAIGQELGLHRDCTEWDISEAERGLRKRVAWALYMQDKWASLAHGRPSHIAGHNWLVSELVEGDFESSAARIAVSSGISNDHDDEAAAEAEDERARILFSQFGTLTMILSDVLDTLFSLHAMRDVDDAGKQGTRVILERAKPMQMKLKHWFSQLPGPLRLDGCAPGSVSSVGKVSTCRGTRRS